MEELNKNLETLIQIINNLTKEIRLVRTGLVPVPEQNKNETQKRFEDKYTLTNGVIGMRKDN